ncbi:MAG: helicase C-terminal domain-containing protein, partial [Spirochaetaceae bacterium]|nr:helicase C-terminal domain-containing protein [Spirochaetaceae bacterium]
TAFHEARVFLRWLHGSASFCAKFKDYDTEPETVFWAEKGKTAQGEVFVRYTETPLDITGMMDEAVFTKFRSVVCTSATLSVGESFDFWKGRVGLLRSSAAVETAVYPSPFPFRTNALLAIDTGAPPPESPAYREYIDRAVPRLLKASRGHALVLFTSYDAMRSAHEAAKPAMEALGIVTMRQGEGERSKLLDAFKSDLSSVLFATDSFWEGVDAPGETLQLVIICKLPFRVPTDPIQMARSEAIEKRGGNAFMEISLPEAVIRLKQGFGRLIRHSMDRGAVVILDSRIVTKRYGNLFVQSLPECRLVTDGLGAIEKEVGKFLFDW